MVARVPGKLAWPRPRLPSAASLLTTNRCRTVIQQTNVYHELHPIRDLDLSCRSTRSLRCGMGMGRQSTINPSGSRFTIHSNSVRPGIARLSLAHVERKTGRAYVDTEMMKSEPQGPIQSCTENQTTKREPIQIGISNTSRPHVNRCCVVWH